MNNFKQNYFKLWLLSDVSLVLEEVSDWYFDNHLTDTEEHEVVEEEDHLEKEGDDDDEKLLKKEEHKQLIQFHHLMLLHQGERELNLQLRTILVWNVNSTI